ncbi:MAG: DUF4156 domain-containing protein [Bdellovibrionales bacterium]|nr:DUF4156 domain-containing protein [Bdellovibrionales bacterium]
MRNLMFIGIVSIVATSCSIKSIEPRADKVVVSKETPADKCKNLGRVLGRTIGTTPDIKAAIEDMKKEAAYKGANYVVMEEASGFETAVSGTAFYCP